MKKKWIIVISIIVIIALWILYIYRRNTLNSLQNYQPFANVWNTVNKQGINYKTISENMLGELIKYFKKYEVEIMPVYGTLLGMIRHQDIIPWDDDIDICIPKNKFNLLLDNKEYFKTKGIGVVEVRPKYCPGYFLKLYDLSEPIIKGKNWSWPFIDIFSWEQVGNNIIISDVAVPWSKSFKISDVFPLKSNLFGKNILSIPNKPDIILNNMYGKDWETRYVSTAWNHRQEKAYKKTYSINSSDVIKADDKLFDNVWVINLEKRQDRWDKSKERLEALGIHPNRWTATNATDKDFIDYYKTISKSKCSRSEIACYKSHVKLWEHLYNTGVEYAIIFEDDIIFPPKVTKDIIINVINDSWGFNIIFLGHCYSHLSSFEDPSSKVGSALCNHGYVITRKAIEKILPMTNNYSIPIDKVTKNFCNKNLCYISHHIPLTKEQPFWKGQGIVHQDEELGSNITDKKRNPF
jgi:GR25 family glycosyltransferase involved in LPS biosynthesis